MAAGAYSVPGDLCSSSLGCQYEGQRWTRQEHHQWSVCVCLGDENSTIDKQYSIYYVEVKQVIFVQNTL